MSSPFDIYKTFFACKAWANAEAFDVLDQSLDSVGHDQVHSALRILNHVYVVDRIFQANLQNISHGYTALNTPETPSLEGLRENVLQLDQWYIAYVADLADSYINKSIAFTFVDGSPGMMTCGEILGHIITHGSYHRGAVGQLLSNAGIKPPCDGLTVFLQASKAKEYFVPPTLRA